MEVRPMMAGDLEPALTGIANGGGGDRRQLFHFYFNHPACHQLVAVIDGVVAGTVVATSNGKTGWLGSVFVMPAGRRQGIGTALTRAAVQYLQQLGCGTIVLLASPYGRPIYERLGFRAIAYYPILAGPALQTCPQYPQLTRMTLRDLPQIYKLDRHATGEDRSKLLSALGTAGWVVSDRNGKLRGYHIPTAWGEGPIVATDPEAGQVLMAVSRVRGGTGSQAFVRYCLPMENAVGRNYLAEAGFQEVRLQTRMVLGEDLEWQANEIWGLLNMGLG